MHVLLIPGLLLGLISAHMLLLVYQKHTQWPGPGRTNDNVVGYPLLPVYMAKAGGFFFIVFGVTALMGALMQINPIWMYGPYDPGEVTAGSQPDWYMGWLEGGLRIMPNWETHLWGFTISWNVLIPGLALMGLLFTVPRVPTRSSSGGSPATTPSTTCSTGRATSRRGPGSASPASRPTACSGSPAATTSSRPTSTCRLNSITWFMRFAIFIGPVIAFIIARRWAISLQRHDRDLLLHGYETGVIVRSPDGGYTELHAPISPERAYAYRRSHAAWRCSCRRVGQQRRPRAA